jgi:hypothetical protein
LAYAATFGTGVGNYALLLGDYLALYVDRCGDLGAPRNATTPTHPGGSIDASGNPYINSDGSVDSLGGTNCYAALYSSGATNAGTIQQQVQAKTEYITVGNRNTVESWSINVNNGLSFTTIGGSLHVSMTTAPITASYNEESGLVSATGMTTYLDAPQHVTIQHEVYFNDAGRKNVVQFVVTFTNLGSSGITLQYARGVNPNQGVPPDHYGWTNTNQWFSTPVDPTLFAVNSADQEGFLRYLALGVRAGEPNTAGSIIYVTNGGQTENALLTSPHLPSQGNPNDVVLSATGGWGANFYDGYNPAYDSYSPNYASAPFVTGYGQTFSPVFSAFSESDLVLLSPIMDIGPGQSATYVFYYTFGTAPIASGTPAATGAVETPATWNYLSTVPGNYRFRGQRVSLVAIGPERGFVQDATGGDQTTRGLLQATVGQASAYQGNVSSMMQTAQRLYQRLVWQLGVGS